MSRFCRSQCSLSTRVSACARARACNCHRRAPACNVSLSDGALFRFDYSTSFGCHFRPIAQHQRDFQLPVFSDCSSRCLFASPSSSIGFYSNFPLFTSSTVAANSNRTTEALLAVNSRTTVIRSENSSDANPWKFSRRPPIARSCLSKKLLRSDPSAQWHEYHWKLPRAPEPPLLNMAKRAIGRHAKLSGVAETPANEWWRKFLWNNQLVALSTFRKREKSRFQWNNRCVRSR